MKITLEQETGGVVYYNHSTGQFLWREGMESYGTCPNLDEAYIGHSGHRGLTTEQIQYVKENGLKECDITQTRIVEYYQ